MAAKLTPLIVIVGETGSGKSALAMEMAKKFNGEIICADSRTVYKGMDIGTAKPSKKDQKTIRHHLLDVIEPSQPFTVANFQQLANQAIKDILNRGKVPFLVGGSGLYIDAVIYNFSFNPNGQRDPQNPRHLLKNISMDKNKNLRPNTLIIGLKIDRMTLEDHLRQRVENMTKRGFAKEVASLIKKFGIDKEAFNAPGYKAFIKFLNKEINQNDAKRLFVNLDLNLAKRQRTWFKRNKSIQWVRDKSQAVELTTTFLNT